MMAQMSWLNNPKNRKNIVSNFSKDIQRNGVYLSNVSSKIMSERNTKNYYPQKFDVSIAKNDCKITD